MKVVKRSELECLLLLRKKILFQKPRILVLSGGASVKKLARQIFKFRISKTIVRFVLTDERLTSDKGKFNRTFYVKLRSAHWPSISSEVFLPASKKRKSSLGVGAACELRRVSLGILGVGVDGHVAGLFSKSQTNKTVQVTDGPDGLKRISLSLATLMMVEKKYIYLPPEKNWDIVREAFPNSPADALMPDVVYVSNSRPSPQDKIAIRDQVSHFPLQIP